MKNHLGQDITVLVLVLAIAAAMLAAGITGHWIDYHGRNYTRVGVAWDWGGFDFVNTADPAGLFVCPAGWNQFPYEVGSRWGWLQGLWGVLFFDQGAPFPVVDC